MMLFFIQLIFRVAYICSDKNLRTILKTAASSCAFPDDFKLSQLMIIFTEIRINHCAPISWRSTQVLMLKQ